MSGARPGMAGPVLIVGLLAGLVSCGGGSAGGGGAQRGALAVEDRVFSDTSDFLRDYWRRPVPLQGEAPERFSALEASLDPAVCGTCHAEQYADWSTAVHAGAYSPGLAGQLVNMATYPEVMSCLVCHAPLSEQSAMVPDTSSFLVANAYFEKGLQAKGLVCAACHVRGWKRYGPPRRDGSLASTPGAPHGGATRTPFFEDSRFCSGCHQFEWPAPNGKSLQNTYVEWRESRYGRDGPGCQACHMPDRRHLWRGIHDSAMVASGIRVEWVKAEGGGGIRALRVRNTGTGHRFPTYVTPEVIVRIERLDEQGQPLGDGVEQTIGRRVEFRGGSWVELSDTRLAPDSSLALVVPVAAGGGRRLRGTVRVRPDAFYEGMFGAMLSGALSDTSRSLIAAAWKRAGDSEFFVFDDTVEIQ